MFHERSYDAVGLTTITRAMGINPPSFYAAFGSKKDFFERILRHYCDNVLPLDEILVPGRPPVEAINDMLQKAAETFSADPRTPGCLLLEALRSSGSPEVVSLARQLVERKRDKVRKFVAETDREASGIVSDIIANTLSGLSAGAREGWNVERLLAVVHGTSSCIAELLSGSCKG